MMKSPVPLAVGTVALMITVVGVTTLDAHRHPRRDGALRGDAAALHATVMRAEERTPTGRAVEDPRLDQTLERLTRAIAENDRTAATYLWRDAYGLALGSRSWEPMVAVGDAALALGAMTGSRKTAEDSAREAYVVALVRARRAESGAGVLRVADAISALGDGAMAREVRRLGDTITAKTGASDVDEF